VKLSPEEEKKAAIDAKKEELLKNEDLAKYVNVIMRKMKVPVL